MWNRFIVYLTDKSLQENSQHSIWDDKEKESDSITTYWDTVCSHTAARKKKAVGTVLGMAQNDFNLISGSRTSCNHNIKKLWSCLQIMSI